MIDSFVRKEPNFIKRFRDEFLLAPIDIPIILLGLSVHASSQCLLNTVREKSLKLYLRTE